MIDYLFLPNKYAAKKINYYIVYTDFFVKMSLVQKWQNLEQVPTLKKKPAKRVLHLIQISKCYIIINKLVWLRFDFQVGHINQSIIFISEHFLSAYFIMVASD